MKNTLFKCPKCNDTFTTRHSLENHSKSDHQSFVNVKFQNGDVIEVEREEDNMFKCKCGKSFKHPNSLRRHAKGCSSKLVELEEGDRVSMDMDNNDVSESMDLYCRVVPDDCFGLPILYEIC
jgi:uncharacterized Zn-finger protein